MSTAATSHKPDTEGSVIDTIQSLIVAFVLAMTFRGFVTEGFVIPTGSMAPTLLGRHMLIHSEQTGTEFAAGLDPMSAPDRQMLADPLLGPGEHREYWGSAASAVRGYDRMGDRILVLKCLYPFWEPKRFDVVVFKNPTDPVGDQQNFIKRLIGLPDEQVWLVDGDVFSMPKGSDRFFIQRKPECIQDAVWRPVFDSDAVPMKPERLTKSWHLPWVDPTGTWNLAGRTYSCPTASPTTLKWETTLRSINDWTAYNQFSKSTPIRTPPLAMSDIRICAAMLPGQAGLKTTLHLRARGFDFEFTIDGAAAVVRMRPAGDEGAAWVSNQAAIEPFRPGEPVNVEFWHVDQSAAIFIGGKRTASLEYDWQPMERLQRSTGRPEETDVDSLLEATPVPVEIEWSFAGSPVELRRVRLDRDLFYRHCTLDTQQTNGPAITGEGFGVHPTENAAKLGPDKFMMCGDNSQNSQDSRLWGRPHELVAKQIDDEPFTVDRRLLLGKAYLVYFPAPFSLTDKGVSIVPDFGRLRLIR